MITTCTGYIEYLVAQGTHAGLAKAMVTEFFDMGDEEGRLIDSDGEVLQLEEEHALATFNKGIVEGYKAKVTNEGIEFDGALTFDLQGSYL